MTGVAHTYLRPAAAPTPSSLTAVQVAQAYGFPASTGAGQTIAIIELGGGFDPADLQTYFSGLGLPVPTVTAVSVDGAVNVPGGDPQGADGEVLLDIEVAGAVAPGADLVVYFAPNTDAGFLNAINAATNATPTPCAISISWGGPESSWSTATMQAYDTAFAAAKAKGIVVLCAAGDAGADDGTSARVADFPCSSPHVIACGGTRLTLDGSGVWASETVWDDGPSSSTGGGYSQVFDRPQFQPAAVGPFRGVPDIAGNADPQSGYEVMVDGQAMVIGGTSAVAPLLAGLVARLAALSGGPVGDLVDVAYANPSAFTDITSGGNEGYGAGAGWDPASGLGSPAGGRLLTAITGTPAPTPPPTPTPVPPPVPTPVPPPVPTPPPPLPIPPPVDVDAALWEQLRPWATDHHVGANKAAARAVKAWAGAKGYR